MTEVTVSADRRDTAGKDRRARPRGGRRDEDAGAPWYVRRKWWLAIASVAFVGWRRLARRKAHL